MKSLAQRGMKAFNLAKLKAVDKLKKKGKDKIKKTDQGNPSIDNGLPAGFFSWWF